VRVLPAISTTTWLVPPRGEAEGGLIHDDKAVRGVVEGHNYLMGYYGKALVPCQYWESARVRVTATSFVRVAVYVVRPRLGMRGVKGYWRIDQDAANGQVRLRCADTGQVQDLGHALVGQSYGTSSIDPLGVAGRPDQDTIMEVWLARGGAATYIDLLAFELADADLVAVNLP